MSTEAEGIQRYEYWPIAGIGEYSEGEWVKYDDHLAVLSASSARVEKLEAALREFIRVTESGVEGGMIHMDTLEPRLDAMSRIMDAREAARTLFRDKGE